MTQWGRMVVVVVVVVVVVIAVAAVVIVVAGIRPIALLVFVLGLGVECVDMLCSAFAGHLVLCVVILELIHVLFVILML